MRRSRSDGAVAELFVVVETNAAASDFFQLVPADLNDL